MVSLKIYGVKIYLEFSSNGNTITEKKPADTNKGKSENLNTP